MSNVNNPHGLVPIMRTLSGGEVRVAQYSKPVGGGTAIFQYDAVTRAAGALSPGGTPGTTLYLGVALNYGAANTATDHLVIDSPDATFEAQGDGSSGGNAPLSAALMGYNANLVFTAGDATLKHSKHQIAESTIATTSTLDVKLLQLLGEPGNAFGANARIELVFNKHLLSRGVAGA